MLNVSLLVNTNTSMGTERMAKHCSNILVVFLIYFREKCFVISNGTSSFMLREISGTTLSCNNGGLFIFRCSGIIRETNLNQRRTENDATSWLSLFYDLPHCLLAMSLKSCKNMKQIFLKSEWIHLQWSDRKIRFWKYL